MVAAGVKVGDDLGVGVGIQRRARDDLLEQVGGNAAGTGKRGEQSARRQQL